MKYSLSQKRITVDEAVCFIAKAVYPEEARGSPETRNRAKKRVRSNITHHLKASNIEGIDSDAKSFDPKLFFRWAIRKKIWPGLKDVEGLPVALTPQTPRRVTISNWRGLAPHLPPIEIPPTYEELAELYQNAAQELQKTKLDMEATNAEMGAKIEQLERANRNLYEKVKEYQKKECEMSTRRSDAARNSWLKRKRNKW